MSELIHSFAADNSMTGVEDLLPKVQCSLPAAFSKKDYLKEK